MSVVYRHVSPKLRVFLWTNLRWKNVKKCTNCGEIKPFSAFANKSSTKDGKAYHCKECRNKTIREQRFDCICENEYCKKPFKGGCRTAKFCSDCGLQNYTFKECRLEALKYNTRTAFALGSGNHYSKAKRKGWLDEVCSHMIPKRTRKTDEELKEEMLKWVSRSDFRNNNSPYYRQALKRDWYQDYAQELWGDPSDSMGFSRSGFAKRCERNFKRGETNGLGLLYLIKFYCKDEWFYKIGITSQGSVKARYEGNDGTRPDKTLNYYYEILWVEEADPDLIYDLEKEYKKETKEMRYQPAVWRGQRATETFKCHGNNKILRKPEIT